MNRGSGWLAIALCGLGGAAAAAQTTHEGATPRWGADVLRHEARWYSSPEARAVADSVLQYQSPHGAWPKNTNLAVPPRSTDDIPRDGRENTIDNGATTLPMRFLAMVAHATGEARYQASCAASITCSRHSTRTAAGRSCTRCATATTRT